ncbi:MOSC domain-containing protein [Cytobacillus praedii]|uniref:MOSC domain-containing protein n=1 Tax=Cytobacillus praedii TaxID=1742358 RepID=UPI002E1B8681|nr:MOSC domain-containing protein [Cytobacillus praedii]MED3573679.1 MOSC domain-containing protein [Cytobacillus praedii]
MGNNTEFVGTIKDIRRFPVKSILGESLSSISIDKRGLFGDRLWAIKDMNGKFGSGKTTRRFQQMDGLFKYKARYEGTAPILTMPDGTEYRGDDVAVNETLTMLLGFPVTLTREESISHFDEGPISIITTSSLRILSQELGEPVDPRRFRANFLIDTELTGSLEKDWVDRLIKVGPNVILKVVAPLERCVMVNNSQEELNQDNRVLRNLVNNHDASFGVWAKVEVSGKVNDGDKVFLE